MQVEITPLPSPQENAAEAARKLVKLIRTIDEHPSIHHLFNEADLHGARRAVEISRNARL